MALPFPLTKEAFFFVFLAILINLIYNFCLGAKLAVILKHAGEKISLLHAFYTFCITKFSSIFTPLFTGTMLSKPLALRHYANIPLSKGFSITLFEQMLDFAMLIVLFPFVLLYLGSHFFSSAASEIAFTVLFIILAILAVITILYKHEFIINIAWKLGTVLPKRIVSIFKKHGFTKENTTQSFKELKEYFTNKRLMLNLLPYLFLQLAIIPFVLKYTAVALGIPLSYKASFLVYFVSVTIGKLSGLPGGFGSTDITMGGLLLFFNLTAIQATSIVILFRIVSLLPVLVIGGYLTFYLSVKYSLKLTSKETQEDQSPKN